MAPRKTENNAYAKFWGDKQRMFGMLWYFEFELNFNSVLPNLSLL